MIKKITAAAILLTAICVSAFAQAPRIATVDLGQLFNQYWKVTESQAMFDAAVQKANEELEKMMAELQAADEKVGQAIARAQNPALTESARETAQAEAMKMREKLLEQEAETNQYGQRTNQNLAQQRQQIIQGHLNEIRGIIREIAADKSYDLVLNTDGGQVIFAADKFDITKSVLSVLNADAPAK
jgi:Skp family chaperone for outer membrane proteins